MTTKKTPVRKPRRRAARPAAATPPPPARSMGRIPSIADAEGVLGPARDWAGRCFEIATAFVEKLGCPGVAVYGHWTGPIHPRSPFAERAKLGFTGHGWIVQADGSVIDPTRWAFENRSPYLFIGDRDSFAECNDFEVDEDGVTCRHCNHVEEEHRKGFFRPCRFCAWPYDEGGNELRRLMRRPMPEWDASAERFSLGVSLEFVLGASERARRGVVTKEQAFWIANLPYEAFGARALEVYQALEKAGLGGFAPIDNVLRAQREAPARCQVLQAGVGGKSWKCGSKLPCPHHPGARP